MNPVYYPIDAETAVYGWPHAVMAAEAVKGVGRLSGWLGASVLSSAVMLAPYAAQQGIEDARVHTTIGMLDSTLRLTGNSESSVRSSLIDVYIPKSKYGIGICAEIEGVDDSVSLDEITSRKSLKIFAGTLEDARTTTDVYAAALRGDAIDRAVNQNLRSANMIGQGIFLAFAMTGVTNKRITARQIAVGALGTGIVFGLTAVDSYQRFNEWGAVEQVAETKYSLDGLEGTAAEGAYTDTRYGRFVLNVAIPRYVRLEEQLDEDNESFRANVDASVPLQARSGPRENEIAFGAMSDIHSNRLTAYAIKADIQARKDKFGSDSLAFGLDAGDREQNSGAAIESRSHSMVVDIWGNTPLRAVNGNHDPKGIETAEDAGLDLINDETDEIEGVRVLGRHDVQHSPFLGPSTYDEGMTEKKLGEEARIQAIADQPGVFLVHQPAAAKAFLQIEDLNELQNRQDSLREFITDNIPDAPAKLVLFGHEHDEVEPFIIRNSDGTWTLVAELGTAGGAIENPTPNNFSLPLAPPQKTASYMTFFMNKDSGLITGYQRTRIQPDGQVEVMPRVDVGSIDGQPFPVATAPGAKGQTYQQPAGREQSSLSSQPQEKYGLSQSRTLTARRVASRTLPRSLPHVRGRQRSSTRSRSRS